ncbi:MAG: monooxygenase [Actinobacteria bacterium]|nr:monooxygenase [Actinomycetota bacterium]
MSQPEPVPPLVTLHLWRVARTRIPQAIARMAVDRGRARRTPGVRFAKMLGTGDGRTFTVRDADPTRWAMLTTWSTTAADSPVARSWSRIAEESFRVDLRPLVSRGRWSGREPFGNPEPRRTTGPVAAVTRARLSARKAPSFWSAVPPVSDVLQRSPGLLAAVGIGEAPVGLQGTFSLWSSGDALRDFAHREAAHTDVIARTQTEGWYAEELFARFEVLGSDGTLDGRDPLA